ncbi:fumarylacetoacetate hydrolase family protein [Methylobacterium sp. J-068]|uniref:fumarylacetoacetate hydrolase family protein n=1 Tax=Methylobacterium sp. J-068 TaxID=2836649 RepID=UPI001FBB56AA|nr:fumarylacetoacetate hydrolase family protein [Methylobacterium sp. J-068]MCJ2035659.1 fumarylacetoacetate hydrolase family protein [Methylobacterium sp. J-068]
MSDTFMSETFRSDTFDPQPAADLLLAAYREGRQFAELPEAVRPRTMTEGYDIQDRLLAAIGDGFAGWKLAIGSAKGKRTSGVGRSIAGRVLKGQLHEPGAALRMPHAGAVTVEFEIAYLIARDIAPDAPAVAAASVVAETRVAFELVLSRFFDRRAVGWPSFAADNSAFQALVIGPAIEPADLPELARSLVVTVDGTERVRAVTGEDLTDPLAALTDLMAVARERGETIPAGSIVSTGTLSVPFDLTGPGTVTAAFLGRTLGFTLLPV